MPRYMIVSDSKSGAKSLIREETIAAEADLQEVFAENPLLIPVDDLGISGVMAVGREIGVASGSIDLLCLADDGTPVIVEFKRGPENPDSRRVIAQVLDYGSHLWGLSVEEFEALCSDRLQKIYGTGSLQAAYAHAFGQTSDSESGESGWADFRDNLAQALEKGRFHHLIVSTHLDNVLKRTMRYLAEVGGLAFSGVEVDHFADDNRHMYVPTAFSIDRRRPGRSTTRTSLQGFLAMAGPDARPVWEELLRILDSFQETVFWGKVGFSFRVDSGSKLESLLWGYPLGSSHAQDVLIFRGPRVKEGTDMDELLRKFIAGLGFLGGRLQKSKTDPSIRIGGDGLSVSDLAKLKNVLQVAAEDLRSLR